MLILLVFGIVELSHNDRNVILIGFDHDLSILTGDSKNVIDLHNYYVISHLNKISLIQRSSDFLLSTSQDNDFDIASYYVDYHYSGKKCINSGY